MVRGKGSRVHMGRPIGEKHRVKVIKGRVLVGKNIYRVVEVIDYTDKTSRLVAEAPPKIKLIIEAGLYKYIR